MPGRRGLHSRYTKLTARGKNKNQKVVAGRPGTAWIHLRHCYPNGGEIPAASCIGHHACHSRRHHCVASPPPVQASRRLTAAPCRSLPLGLDGPGGDARTLPEMREWQDLLRQAEVELAAVETHTKRRGSSRRIMTVRFRPAYIRVINRRYSAFNCHLLCFQNKKAGSWTIHPIAGPNQSAPLRA